MARLRTGEMGADGEEERVESGTIDESVWMTIAVCCAGGARDVKSECVDGPREPRFW